ncbi:hybrid signal transduction histidine kinase M [Tanacetum coccineum]
MYPCPLPTGAIPVFTITPAILMQHVSRHLTRVDRSLLDIIVYREIFPYLKTVRSMLTTEEMRLKSRAQATPIDSSSSSLMVLLANSGNSTRRPNVAHVKLKKPCFNFDKGFCHFCDNCKFIHGGTSNGVKGNNSLWSTSNVCHASLSTTTPSMAHNQMMALIQTQQALLAQLGYNGNLTLGKSTINPGNTQHVALNTGINGPIQSISHATSPPGFACPQPPTTQLLNNHEPILSQPAQHGSTTYPVSHAHGQATSS